MATEEPKKFLAFFYNFFLDVVYGEGYPFCRMKNHSPQPEAPVSHEIAGIAAEITIEKIFSDIIGPCDPLAARLLLRSTISIIDQDTKLEGLLAALPSGEFQREFFAKASAAFAEACSKSEETLEEISERIENDAEYLDGLLSRARQHSESIRKEVA